MTHTQLTASIKNKNDLKHILRWTNTYIKQNILTTPTVSCLDFHCNENFQDVLSCLHGGSINSSKKKKKKSESSIYFLNDFQDINSNRTKPEFLSVVIMFSLILVYT